MIKMIGRTICVYWFAIAQDKELTCFLPRFVPILVSFINKPVYKLKKEASGR